MKCIRHCHLRSVADVMSHQSIYYDGRVDSGVVEYKCIDPATREKLVPISFAIFFVLRFWRY